MKIVTIGGGSTYTPELLQGLLVRHERLNLKEWWLMDIDRERLNIVSGFVQRVLHEAGAPFQIKPTTNREQALDGADFVTTQIRVGQMQARKQDELLGRRWNLVGQETTGIGGMAKALRTVPVLLSIADDMTRLCPQAWLVNFTNPSGLVTEALQRYRPQVRSVGLCNGPIGFQMAAAKERGVSPFEIRLDYLGLNHLAWIRGAKLAGQDIWPEMFKKACLEAKSEEDSPLPVDMMERLGVICNGYLRYYYRTPKVLEEQARTATSRADRVMEIEAGILSQYADPSLKTIPADLMKRGGAYYSTVAIQCIESMVLDLGEVQIVNARQAGAVPNLPPDWVMELPSRIDRTGVHPLPSEPLPLFAEGLLRAVKAYELLTAEAAITGSRDLALQALLVHPLGPDADRALAVLEDLLKTHSAHLPAFA